MIGYRAACIIDSASGAACCNYDPLGRLVATTNPVSGTTLYTYTATTLLQGRDPAGHVTSYGYDGADRLLAWADPTGDTASSIIHAPTPQSSAADSS